MKLKKKKWSKPLVNELRIKEVTNTLIQSKKENSPKWS